MANENKEKQTDQDSSVGKGITDEQREEMIEDAAITAANSLLSSALDASNEQMRVNQIEVAKRVGVKIIASILVNEAIKDGKEDQIQANFGDYQHRILKQVQDLLVDINSGEAEFVPTEKADDTETPENKH